MHVAVCCITFRRPNGLRRLLAGLNALRFDKTPQPEITVVVVNNNPDAPIRPVIEEIKPLFRWCLIVGEEAAQGVSSARNRALDLLPAGVDAVAFIDDDEVPEARWLDELIHVCRASGATIVQGPVRPQFSEGVPDWIVRGRFFEHGPYADGTPLHYAATNNSLIGADVIHALGLRFDLRFNRTGGEDQQFFGAAIRAGHRVVTACNAIVIETVPKSRTCLRYLLRRRFRMGGTLAMIDRIEDRRRWRTRRLLKGLGRMALGAVQTLSVVTDGRVGFARGLMNVAWGAGAVAGLLGFAHREYAAPDGAAPLAEEPVAEAPG
jgi:succinoglycan biosynthesis protein ExoM